MKLLYACLGLKHVIIMFNYSLPMKIKCKILLVSLSIIHFSYGVLHSMKYFNSVLL